jgi:hypothetical protein
LDWRGSLLNGAFLPALLLGIGTALIYGRVAGFGYANFDDVTYVLGYTAVREGLSLESVHWAFTEFHLGNWHPLTTLSYMLDVTLFGLDPGPQHVVNAVLHAFNSILVYLLAQAMLRHRAASLVVAWLFMAHPLRVESVAWIAERKDLLCGLFFLLTLLAYLRHRAAPSLRRYALVILCFVLALLSKPMAVTLPVVLVLLDYWPLNRLPLIAAGSSERLWRQTFALVIEKLPLFALSLASGIVTIAAQTGALSTLEALSVIDRVMLAVRSYAVYLRDTLFPTELAAFYPYTPVDVWTEFLPSLLLLASISTAVLAQWRKRPWLLAGWLWYLVTLLPVIGLLHVGLQSHADRYTYLPSIGLYLALGAAMATLSVERWRAAALGLVPLALFLAAMSWVQVGYWSGQFMVFTRVIDVAGDNYFARINLASHMVNIGKIDEAEDHALRAIELAPSNATAHATLAHVRIAQGRFAEAEMGFRKALTLAPKDATLMNHLAYSVERQGRIAEARSLYEAAIARDPNLYGLRENLARLLAE